MNQIWKRINYCSDPLVSLIPILVHATSTILFLRVEHCKSFLQKALDLSFKIIFIALICCRYLLRYCIWNNLREIKKKSFKDFFNAQGQVISKEMAYIRPEINGTIKSILIKEGQYVNKLLCISIHYPSTFYICFILFFIHFFLFSFFF